MAKFVWQPPGQEPMAFAIRQERVAVGRDAGNDIRLPEPAVSARHAVIITRMGISTVHDLNSSNGTWINGKRIESQQLRHGDTVQFGRLAMNYIDESNSSAPSPPGQAGSTLKSATVTMSGLSQSPQSPALPKLNDTGAFKATSPSLPADAPDLSELDRLLGSIRSYRSGEQQHTEQKRAEMLVEWGKIMHYCQALKTKLSPEPRVRYFEISERRNEVVIRIERAAGQPTQLLMLTWGHIELKERTQDGIWMRQPGLADKRFEKCADATRELVTAVAHLLA